MGICIENKRNKIRSKEDEINNPNAGSVPVENIRISSECICKIVINIEKETSENNKGTILATGFFIDIYPSFKCLITNYHVISQEMVDSNTVIEIINDKGEKERLKLNKDERYIKCLDGLIDITVIQIKNTDRINKKFKSLEPDLNYQRGYQQYKNEDIFILQHPLGQPLKSASGKVKDIDDDGNDFLFYHNIDTEGGSSGSPVILTSNSKVIGVHTGGSEDNDVQENSGTFLGYIFPKIEKDIKSGLIKNIKVIPNISNIKDNDNNKSNYITAEINIDNKNINKDILIINSYEESRRIINVSNLDESLKNEKEIMECEIKINNKKINFSYTQKFNKVGRYTIYYKFKNKLVNCNHMFSDCSLLSIINLTKLDTENIIDISYMFADCTSLINADLSYCNIKNVKEMQGIFYGCTSLKNISLKKIQTQKVENLSWAFYGCSSLIDLDLSDFETGNIVNMSSMFAECSSLVNINLKNFRVENAKNMYSMFGSCSSIRNLDLSYFSPQNVINMNLMFFNCNLLSNLNMENLITKNNSDIDGIFYGCYSLKKENLICSDKNVIEQMSQKK